MRNTKRITALVLAALLMLALAGCSGSDYKAAGELYEAGDYKAASEKYSALGDYKDSADLAVKSDYMYARELYYAGAYEAAAQAFNALEGYEDSADMSVECVYKLAVETFDAGKYADAIEIFLEVEDYQDSADYITRAREAIILQSVLGEWKCVYDLSGLFSDSFETGFGLTSELNPDDYFDFSDYKAEFVLTVNEDGSYVLDVDREAYNTSFSKLGDSLKTGTAEMFKVVIEEEVAAQGLTMDYLMGALGVSNMDELIEYMMQSSFGMNLDSFVDSLMEAGNAENAFSDMPFSGTFTLSGTTLTLSNGSTAEYDVVNEKLTLTEIAAGDTVYQSMIFTR